MNSSSPSSHQLADYDFPNSKERVKYEDEIEIQNLFYQFAIQYRRFFSTREKNNQKGLQSEIDKKGARKIRENISVLVIIGSSFNIPAESLYGGKYQKNAEDLSTALFIRHIFHNVFGIPYSQIIITSTENDDFVNIDNNIDLISDSSYFYYKKPDKSPKSKYYFVLKEEEEFKLFQDINLIQVGINQFKFLFPKSIKDIVKPFNVSIIQNEYPQFTNDESNLFVFFLDHRYPNTFCKQKYQFFIERLLEIKCKHFYVCNDSCNSGSMIKLIEICQRFKNLFPSCQHIEVELVLFSILTSLKKVNNQCIQQEINDKIKDFDFGDINQKSKDEAIQKLKNLDDQMLKKTSRFVDDLEEEFSNTKCIPKHFLEFAQKATIFASSSFDQPSFTLPGREFTISIKQNPRTRIFGNVFSSIFIESLLNKKAHKSLKEFNNNIIYLFGEYKKLFKRYIIYQNVPKVANINNDFLLTPNDVDMFFDYRIEDNSRHYNIQDNWPDLSSIMLDEKFWNVDISKVNEDEYKNVHFGIFQFDSIKSQINNPNNFGPARNMNYNEKFKKDFEKAVNCFLAEFYPKEEFSAFNSEMVGEVTEQKCIGYAQFVGEIRPIKPNFSRVIISLKNPIANYFFHNPNNIERSANCFVQAFKTISPFWDKYDI